MKFIIITLLLLVNICLVAALDVETANYIDAVPLLNLSSVSIVDEDRGPNIQFQLIGERRSSNISSNISTEIASGPKKETISSDGELFIGNSTVNYTFYTDFLSINLANSTNKSEILWYKTIEGENLSNAKLLYLNNKLFVGTDDNVYVLDATNGTILKSFSVSVINKPAIKPSLNLIFVPFKTLNNRTGVAAYNYENNTLIRTKILNDSLRLKVLGDYLYGISDEKKKIYVVDLNTNELKLTYNFNNISNIGEIYREHYDKGAWNFYGIRNWQEGGVWINNIWINWTNVWMLSIKVDDKIYKFRS